MTTTQTQTQPKETKKPTLTPKQQEKLDKELALEALMTPEAKAVAEKIRQTELDLKEKRLIIAAEKKALRKEQPKPVKEKDQLTVLERQKVQAAYYQIMAKLVGNFVSYEEQAKQDVLEEIEKLKGCADLIQFVQQKKGYSVSLISQNIFDSVLKELENGDKLSSIVNEASKTMIQGKGKKPCLIPNPSENSESSYSEYSEDNEPLPGETGSKVVIKQQTFEEKVKQMKEQEPVEESISEDIKPIIEVKEPVKVPVKEPVKEKTPEVHILTEKKKSHRHH